MVATAKPNEGDVLFSRVENDIGAYFTNQLCENDTKLIHATRKLHVRLQLSYSGANFVVLEK